MAGPAGYEVGIRCMKCRRKGAGLVQAPSPQEARDAVSIRAVCPCGFDGVQVLQVKPGAVVDGPGVYLRWDAT